MPPRSLTALLMPFLLVACHPSKPQPARTDPGNQSAPAVQPSSPSSFKGAIIGRWMSEKGGYFDFARDGTMKIMLSDRQSKRLNYRWADDRNVHLTIPGELNPSTILYIINITEQEIEFRNGNSYHKLPRVGQQYEPK